MKPVILSKMGRVHDADLRDGCEDLARIRRMDAPMQPVNGKQVMLFKLTQCDDCFTDSAWKALIARG